MTSYTQADRPIGITTPLEVDTLLLQSVLWEEELGKPFLGKVRMLSTQAAIDPMKLLGKSATVRLDYTTKKPAYRNGIIQTFQNIGTDGSLYCYYAEIVPWFQLAKHQGGIKIYQDLNAPMIAALKAADLGFSGQLKVVLSGVPAVRPYCVQFNESDFDFLSRLFEEEGLYYFFQHTDTEHCMVIADNAGAHAEVVGYEKVPLFSSSPPANAEESALQTAGEFVSDWISGQHFSTAANSLCDYDFTQQSAGPLIIKQDAQNCSSTLSWYHFPGRFFDNDVGKTYARVRMESRSAHERWIRVKSTLRQSPCGAKFQLVNHPIEALNQPYIISRMSLELFSDSLQPGDSSTNSLECELGLHPLSVPYRSLITTPRPIASGPQLATVTGPDGKEIWTDTYGRIKIKFPWDQNTPDDPSDSSCWVRVAQSLTGQGFGASAVPRVGEEVIVQFINGDIDRPVVVGRLYNSLNMPPNTLPDDQAKTVFRTRSTAAGTLDDFHELTFDDTAGSELIYFHSQKDFQREVENNDSLTVGSSDKGGDQTIDIAHDQSLKVGVTSGKGGQTVEIQKDRSITIHEGNDSLVVEKGNLSHQIKNGTVTIEAAQSITLKCGDSSIVLSPSGITVKGAQLALTGSAGVKLQGPEVSVNADGQLTLAGGATTNVKGGAEVVIKGAIVMIN